LPVYEYRCSTGHFYEKQEGFDAPNQHKCVECRKVARRQLSLPAVIFKGSGFYSTDNRSGSRRNGESSSSESSSTESSGSKPSASTPAANTSDGPGPSHGRGDDSRDSKPKVEAAVD
jgi:putative FmdB family regulatory protein